MSTEAKHPLRGLVIAQALGSFNDNAWKQIVILLAIAAASRTAAPEAAEAAAQEQAAFVQLALIIPLMLVSLPAGMLADRLSKRTVLVAMKALELVLMLAGAAVLYAQPLGGSAAVAVLMLLGVQAALFSPAKYGILPELLPHERLSAGNGLLELWNNVAIIGGMVAGGYLLEWTHGRPWVTAVGLSALSVAGLATAWSIPRVPPARAEGGVGETVRMAWAAIRSDRILRLAIRGQIFVWGIASLVPAPVLAYSKNSLNLGSGRTGFPLAAIAIGIGAGCFAAGRLSGAKVEYGLLPFGALGLTVSTLAFAAIGPGEIGTIALMGFVGFFAGILFVPLNALIQVHAPEDRRGAVIALANVLVYAGMLAGTATAMVIAGASISARGTFLGASLFLGCGFLWALWLVPDAFLRFVLVLLANTLYRVRVLGRPNVPLEGGALLTPNHVSFADGLFIIASLDRRVRFVVYSDYFRRPLMGVFLRSMGAIPISGDGGPKEILRAFREAGKALDEGRLVCIFPEGQITRTGLLQPFQRGLERIVKGRTTPIIPVHIDRAAASLFSPTSGRRFLPERIPFPITVSFGAPLPAETPVHEIRRAIHDLDCEAWTERKADRRPLHHEYVRRARRHPFRPALMEADGPGLSFIGALAASVALARALRPRWAGQEHVGLLLPSSKAAALANLAAALAGRAAVNLNHTAGRAAMTSAARQAGLRTVLTSRAFREKAKVEIPDGLEVVHIEDVVEGIRTSDRAIALLHAWLFPVRLLERSAGATKPVALDDTATVLFSSGSTGEPKGVVLSHFNLDSNVEAIGQVFRTRAEDRVLDVLPPFHAFGYLLLWLAPCRGVGLICHPNPLEAVKVGAAAQRHRATILLATPTFLRLYLRRVSPSQFGSLRILVAGAEKLPEALALEFEDGFGLRPLEGYGMTECAPVVAVSALDYRGPGFFQPGTRRGFVGHPLPGVSVRVVDVEKGTRLDPNEQGMVHVRGPNVMRGYLGRDDLTQSVLHDGWYITGDLGVMDEDGFLKITGRESRFSKIGGEMVPHEKVEEVLQEAVGAQEPVFAVTAVQDGRADEALAVLYTVGEDEVKTALEQARAQGLPNLFLPRRDHFVKVEKLPLLGTGKLDLRAVRRMAEEALAHG
jgi:acyl-[acyl-carrier-protein]-phospholipid O-acyltransferase/long-chain-fatty-acid--[acyl-carrier-protein] ligase